MGCAQQVSSSQERLVDRLFQADAPKRERPEQRFARTTAGLKGTDSVISVLVSHVEALVAKVEGSRL